MTDIIIPMTPMVTARATTRPSLGGGSEVSDVVEGDDGLSAVCVKGMIKTFDTL